MYTKITIIIYTSMYNICIYIIVIFRFQFSQGRAASSSRYFHTCLLYIYTVYSHMYILSLNTVNSGLTCTISKHITFSNASYSWVIVKFELSWYSKHTWTTVNTITIVKLKFWYRFWAFSTCDREHVKFSFIFIVAKHCFL